MASTPHTSDPKRRNKQDLGNRGRLTHGTFYEGTIHSCNYSDMTYTVVVAGGETVEGVRDGTGLFNGLIGIKTTNRLSPGTLVLLAEDSNPWIIATAPADTPDLQAYLSRTITGKGYPDAIKTSHPNDSELVPEHNTAEDLYEGEFEMANLLGGFLRFMGFLTTLGIDERNQIEFHMVRDLTRLLSHNFEHFSCDGDRKIYDDGRLNCDDNTTSYDHERMGAVDPFSPKSEVVDALMPDNLDPIRTGRWRFTQLKGFIGDFINSFITDPTVVLGQMTEQAVRSGKSRVHMGQDGTILLQSVSEIAFERVCRIQVPIRIKHEEDPKGVIRKQMDELDKSFLKVWDQDSGKSEHHTLFKIREYIRYLNQYQSLARIHQLAAKSGEWKVPSEAETPAPKVTCGEADRESANQGSATYWKDAYATVRIMRDGSILNFDAYGNSTASGPYGIQHASSRHYHVWAAGDIVMKAGASMFLSARRHIEIIAARGGLALKGRTFLRGLCERGTLWLKSDFDPKGTWTPEEGDPEAEVVDQQGIRIHATKGEARYLSWLKTQVVIEGPPGDDDSGDFVFSTKGGLKLDVGKDLGMDVSKKLLVNVGKEVHWTSGDWIAKAKSFLLPGIAMFKSSEIILSRIKTTMLECSGRIAGPENRGKVVDPASKVPYRAHTNHIQIYDGDAIEVPSDAPETISYNFSEPAGSIYWKLLPEEEYQWADAPDGDVAADADLLYEPLSQQHLRLETPDGYGVWNNACDPLLSGSQTANSQPWPGKSRKWLSHTNPGGPALSKPAPGAATSFTAATQSALTSSGIEFRFLSR
jgi:hypothetical protein